MLPTTALFIEFPENAIAWIAWSLILLILFGFGFLIRRPAVKFNRKRLVWLAGLSVLNLITSSILVIPLKSEPLLLQVLLMPLMALPWMLAGGFVGILSSQLLALAAGFLTAAMHTHSLLTPLLFVSMTLIFNMLIGTRRNGASQEPVHNPLATTLLTAAAAIILIFGTTNLSIQSNYLIKISSEWRIFLQEILMIVPGLALSGILCQIVAMLLPGQWSPLQYQKDRFSRRAVDQAAGQVKSLLNGNYFEPVNTRHNKGGAGELMQSLEELRASLESHNQTKTQLQGLEQLYLSGSSFEQLLQVVLRAALRNDSSSARLILFDKSNTKNQHELQTRLGVGKQNKLYAYLDEIINEQLGHSPQLVLSDMKIDVQLNIKKDMPAPRSLIAFPVLHESIRMGVIWIGYDENHWFSEEDISYYKTLALRASEAIFQARKSLDMNSDRQIFADLLDIVPDPIFYLDTKGNILYSNRSAQRLAEMAAPGSKGSTLQAIMPDGSLLAWLQDVNDFPAEKALSLSEGREYLAVVEKIPELSEKNGRVLILHDATPIKIANAQKSEFVTNVSHDLRTPLTLMKGYTTMLQNIGNLSDQQKMYVQRILSGIENMNRLVNNVLNLERLDSEYSLQFSDVSLQEIISAALQVVELPAQQKKIDVKVDFGGLEEIVVNADRILLQQALINLLDNAVKYSNIAGQVMVLVSRSTSGLRLAVKDDGIGIAPLDQPKVFDRYYRSEVIHDRSLGGYGLGLAIVRSIVERHGGKVGLTSQLGKGSNFHMDFPESMVIKWG